MPAVSAASTLLRPTAWRPATAARAVLCATSRFALAPGERVAVLGPNGGGKTTLFRALLGELAPLAGHARSARAAAASCRRPSARGWTSRSARSTWRSWARSRACPGGGARAARERARGPARRSTPSAWPTAAQRHLRRPLRRPAPARAGRPRARAGRRPWCCSTSPSPAWTRQRRAPRGAARAAGRRGPRAADRHPRRRPGARAGTACCASTAARSPSARPPTSLTARRARGDLRRRRSSTLPGDGSHAVLPPHHHGHD